MPAPSVFLLAGVVLAVVLSAAVLFRARTSRSPSRSVDEFSGAMRALAPAKRRR